MENMSEFKGTKGRWYIERTSEKDGDFQARILSNVGKAFRSGEEKDQIMIIFGEPSKRNGYANIHSKANAQLISKAPEMLEMLREIRDQIEDGRTYITKQDITNLIKEATTI